MELIAWGRDADVYALNESRVLRRYRQGGPTELEARLMTHLAACGYPVLKVYEITDTDMVLERLTGPTMLDVLARRPWQVGSARLFTTPSRRRSRTSASRRYWRHCR